MKNWTHVPAGLINAANQRLWVAFGDNTKKVAIRINTDPSFVATVAQLMVSDDYEPSKSQKLAQKIMDKNFLATEERLFEEIYVRCVDIDSDGYRVVVGGFDSRGLDVNSWHNDDRHNSVCLSSARMR